MAAGSASGSGNVYVVETDSVFGMVKKAVIGKDKVDLNEQVSGLKMQKKNLLKALEENIGEIREAIEDLQSKAQAVKNSSGNEAYTREFTVLGNNYEIMKKYAENEHEAYLKVFKAYEIVIEAFNELFEESVAVVNTDLRVELHHKITTAKQLVEDAELVDETKTAARSRV